MEHFIIFINLFSFAIGISAVYYSVHVYKTYHFSFLRAFILYIILSNLIVFIDLFTIYAKTNFLISQSVLNPLLMYSGLAFFVCAIIMIYAFCVLIWNLLEREITRFIKKIYLLLCLILIIAYALGVISFFYYGDFRLFRAVDAIMNYITFGLFIILSIYLILKVREDISTKRRQLLSQFGYFIIIINIGYSTTGMFHFLETYLLLASITFLFNIALIIYLNRFLTGYFGELSNKKDYKQISDKISIKYNISPREKDIIDMILKGKSNKEIEQKLFLSHHTVKNHIYHIFQKTGVSSRGQLINMIFGSEK